jgi:coenzyme F420-reducing hydrogenase beta subunit
MTHEIDNVVENGLCIGCGSCSLGIYQNIELDSFGRYKAKTSLAQASDQNKQDRICPFSNKSLDEDALASLLGRDDKLNYDPIMGHFVSIWTGHVKSPPYRGQGSSGGITSWLLNTLLANNLVDAIVHVRPGSQGGSNSLLFKYQVSRSSAEINSGAKSHYFPVEMSEVLAHIRNTPGRYAVVALPCFAKSLRSLMEVEPVFKKRISFLIGLFCGHLKSTHFAELLAYQAGMKTRTISSIDFRTKIQGRNAGDYGYTVSDGSRTVTKPMAEVIGRDWGMGIFKYKACDFCDDISAEVADVSIGDAWLPEFISDSNGTNIFIARSPMIHELIAEGRARGELELEPASIEMALNSQAANLRHRIEDLPYRLYSEKWKDNWRPKKRIQASRHISPSRRAIQDTRRMLRDRIPTLWAQYEHEVNKDKFFQRLAPLIQKYQSLYQPKTHITIIQRLQARFRIRDRMKRLKSMARATIQRFG